MFVEAVTFVKSFIKDNLEIFLVLLGIKIVLSFLPNFFLVLNIDSLGLLVPIFNVVIAVFVIKLGQEYYQRGTCKLKNILSINLLVYLKIIVGIIVRTGLLLFPLVLFIIPVLGLPLAIVAVIVFTIHTIFMQQLIVDEGLNPFQALSRSAEIAKGKNFKIFQFSLVVFLIGIFICIPVITIYSSLILDGLRLFNLNFQTYDSYLRELKPLFNILGHLFFLVTVIFSNLLYVAFYGELKPLRKQW